MSPRVPLLVLAALALSAPCGAAAQSVAPTPAQSAHRTTAPLADPSPYELTWARDGLLFAGAGTGILLASVLADDGPRLTLEDLADLSPADVNWFDRPATRRYSTHRLELSQHLRSPLALAPLALLADPRVRADWPSLGVMYVQTMTLAAAVPGITKATISRHRPFVYNTDLSTEERLEDGPGRSFFSRTTTTAFASAVFFATVFADHRPDSALRPWVWGGALAAGGTVGYLRFSSGVHYPSDVLVGAAVGTAVGYLVPRMHRRKARTSEEALSLRVGPGPEGGITLSGTVRISLAPGSPTPSPPPSLQVHHPPESPSSSDPVRGEPPPIEGEDLLHLQAVKSASSDPGSSESTHPNQARAVQDGAGGATYGPREDAPQGHPQGFPGRVRRGSSPQPGPTAGALPEARTRSPRPGPPSRPGSRLSCGTSNPSLT